jgi:hypothetical protein
MEDSFISSPVCEKAQPGPIHSNRFAQRVRILVKPAFPRTYTVGGGAAFVFRAVSQHKPRLLFHKLC